MSLLQYMAYGNMSHYLSGIFYNIFIKNSKLNDDLNNEKYNLLSTLIEQKLYEIDILKHVKEMDLTEDLDEDNTCAICCSNFCKNDEIFILKCKHFYHKKCSRNWLLDNETCPCCRQCI